MFGEKKKTSQEVKWIVTFADLITLLFCFFVYLSLFNKPQVDIKTGFIVNEETIGLSIRGGRFALGPGSEVEVFHKIPTAVFFSDDNQS